MEEHVSEVKGRTAARGGTRQKSVPRLLSDKNKQRYSSIRKGQTSSWRSQQNRKRGLTVKIQKPNSSPLNVEKRRLANRSTRDSKNSFPVVFPTVAFC